MSINKGIISIRKLSDLGKQRFLAGRGLDVMSGDTSSPTDGGPIIRVLPHPAALRWYHYSFVSPVHCSAGISSVIARLAKPAEAISKTRLLRSLRSLAMTIGITCFTFSGIAYAEFRYLNPSRSGLEEIQEQVKQEQQARARQLVGARYARQRALGGLRDLTLEREMQGAVRMNAKMLQAHQQLRQQAQRYLEEEKTRAVQKVTAVRAQNELGFEYSLEKNFDGSLRRILYIDGLVGAILGEKVPISNERGEIVNTMIRDTMDITYFKGGPYHRMRKSFKTATKMPTGETQILEREILEYVPGSKWWGTDDSKLTRTYQMVRKYRDISWSSNTPFKKDIVLVDDIQHNGDRQASRWKEIRYSPGTADPVTMRLILNAEYQKDSRDLERYTALSWNTNIPEVVSLIQWKGQATHGQLRGEEVKTLELGTIKGLPETPGEFIKDSEGLLGLAKPSEGQKEKGRSASPILTQGPSVEFQDLVKGDHSIPTLEEVQKGVKEFVSKDKRASPDPMEADRNSKERPKLIDFDVDKKEESESGILPQGVSEFKDKTLMPSFGGQSLR